MTNKDLFASLARGKHFTKLDLSHAYHQLQLNEEAQKLMVISTHKGLFAYKRLQYGLNSAAGIFQRAMENVFKGIPHIAIYLDDILITAPTLEEHFRILELVLNRVQEAGLRLKKDKCLFLVPEVGYLGHKLSAQGVHTSDEKVLAIDSFPVPKNKNELNVFCGMVKYYHRFLPRISEIMNPLFAIIGQNSVWKWGTCENKAF